jgi:hypothetical protein
MSDMLKNNSVLLETPLIDSAKNSPSEKGPSHNTTSKYVILMETNGKECESWLYFIRKDGNEEALEHLYEQISKIEWYIMDDLSTFDLDLKHDVSALTAKEMSKVDLNSYSFNRKFDGKLKMIDFRFKKKDDDEKMMCKVFDQLGYGQIEDYISDEDIDEEDLETEKSDSSSDDESNSDSSKSPPAKTYKNNSKLPPSISSKINLQKDKKST